MKKILQNKRIKSFLWGLLDAIVVASLAYATQVLTDMEIQHGSTALILLGTLVLEQVTKHYNGKRQKKTS